MIKNAGMSTLSIFPRASIKLEAGFLNVSHFCNKSNNLSVRIAFRTLCGMSAMTKTLENPAEIETNSMIHHRRENLFHIRSLIKNVAEKAA